MGSSQTKVSRDSGLLPTQTASISESAYDKLVQENPAAADLYEKTSSGYRLKKEAAVEVKKYLSGNAAAIVQDMVNALREYASGIDDPETRKLVNDAILKLSSYGITFAEVIMKAANAGGAIAVNAIVTILGPEFLPIAGVITAVGTKVTHEMISSVANTLRAKVEKSGDRDNPSANPNVYFGVKPREDIYRGAAEHYMGSSGSKLGGGKAGGACCGFVGMAEADLSFAANYAGTANAKTKDRIVDDLVKVLEGLGIKAEGKDRAEKVKKMLDAIPAGERFVKTDEAHRKICKVIAEKLNAVYGDKVVDVTLPPEVICQQVFEIVASLGASMHSEFLAVYNEVRRALGNLNILKKLAEEARKQIEEQIKQGDDPVVVANTADKLKIHDVLLGEIGRQLSLLQSLLSVTLLPADRDLTALLREHKNIGKYVQKIDAKHGTDDFGRFIASVLENIGVTSAYAELINRALGEVGMSLDEYLRESSPAKFREKITERLMGRDIPDEALSQYLALAELLYKKFLRDKDIAEVMKARVGSADASAAHTCVFGGYDESELSGVRYPKTHLDKRIESRMKLKRLIFSTFYRRINDIFDSIANSVDVMSQKVGSEIPLSGQLDGLRRLIVRLGDEIVRNKQIYYALIGYYSDAQSKSKKETFVGNLRMINSYIESILEMPLYKPSERYFRDIYAGISSLLETIDKFSDEVKSKFGGGFDGSAYAHSGLSAELAGAAPGTTLLAHTGAITGAGDGPACHAEPDNVYRGSGPSALNYAVAEASMGAIANLPGGIDGPGAVTGAADELAPKEPVIKFKTSRNILDSVRKFDYYYRVAQIKSNLDHTAKEIDHYAGEGRYDKMTASAIAQVLRDEKLKYENFRESLNKLRKEQVEAIVRDCNGDDRLKNVAEVMKEKEAAVAFLDAQWEAKKKFWATVEAVDMYMRIFTDGLVKNPSDIKDIKSMLDEIELYSVWYDDNTGNMFTGVIDHFPAEVDAAGARKYPADRYLDMGDRRHYYEKISEAGSLPGNPYLLAHPSRGADARNMIRRAFTKFGILKNLFTVFVYIGSKFGGQEIRKKVFMTPAQMYMNVVEYVCASAFAQGFGKVEYEGVGGGKSVKVIPERNATLKLSDGTVTTYGSMADEIRARVAAEIDQMRARLRGPLARAIAAEIQARRSNNATENAIRSLLTTIGLPVPPTEALDTSHVSKAADSLARVALGEESRIANVIFGSIEPPELHEMHSKLVGIKDIIGGEIYADGDAVKANLLDKANLNAVLTQSRAVDLSKPYMLPASLQKLVSDLAGVTYKDFQVGFSQGYIVVYPKKYTLQPAGTYAGIDSGEIGVGPTLNDDVNSASDFLTKFGVWMRSVEPNLQAHEIISFRTEDEYFAMLLKAISAKIFTVTGMYDVLDRPLESNTISPIRMIVGGSDEIPKVSEECADLYARLPRFAEFYRDFFAWDDATDYNPYTDIPRPDSAALKISLVPEVEGVFSGLIRIIFRGIRAPSEVYSDDNIKEIVKEINSIYQKMQSKHPQNTILETYHEFVAEINRRYAVVSKKQHNKWESEFGTRYDYAAETLDRYTEVADTEVPILPGEADEEISMISPAEKLLSGLKTLDRPELLPQHRIVKDHYRLLRKFRCKLDERFKDARGMEEHSFKEAIKLAQMKLRRETRDDERFKIVASLIRGVDIYSKIDGMKYILFHETVVSGLNVLSAIHTVLSRLKARVAMIDVGALLDLFEGKKYKQDQLGIGGFLAFLSDVNDYVNKFAGTDDPLGNSTASTRLETLRNVFGKDSNKAANGGTGGLDYTIKHFIGGNIPADVPRFTGNNTGLSGILPAAAYDKLPADIRETLRMYLFDREFVLKEWMETVFGIAADLQGLVEVRVEHSRVFINWSGLKDLVNGLFSSTQYFIDLLRPHIRAEILDQYLNKTQIGSFYWLQEQLMEKIIIGRKGRVSDEPEIGPAKAEYVSLEKVSVKLNEILADILKPFSVDGSGLSAAAASSVNPVDTPVYLNYGQVFADMLFYDGSKSHSGLVASKSASAIVNDAADEDAKIISYASNQYEELHFNVSAGDKRSIDTRFIARFHQLYSFDAELTFNRSLMFAFNQLVAKYIQNCYDPATKKIYLNTINAFANGAFNRSVIDYKYTYPDTTPYIYSRRTSAEDYLPPEGGLMALSGSRYPGAAGLIARAIALIQRKGDDLRDTTSVRVSLRHAMGDTVARDFTAGSLRLAAALIATFAGEIPDSDQQRQNVIDILTRNAGILGTEADLPGRVYDALTKPDFGRLIDDSAQGASDGVLRRAFHVNNASIGTTATARVSGVVVTGNVNSADPTAKDNLRDAIQITFERWVSKDPLMGELITAVMDILPSQGSLAQSARVQADAIVAAYVLYSNKAPINHNYNAGAPDVSSIITAILGVFKNSGKIAGPPTNIDVKTTVGQDDILGVQVRGGPAGEFATLNKYLILASSDYPDAWKNLGGDPPGPDEQRSIDSARVKKFNHRMDTDGDHVLFSSLSAILRSIITSRTGDKQYYVADNVADVPLYMKEKMRAGLPMLRSMLRELVARGLFVKRMLALDDLHAARSNEIAARCTHNPWPFVLKRVETDSTRAKIRFNGIIDAVERGCTALISGIDQTLREIGDEPRYFEIYQGSIRDYKSTYGTDPFMPMSSLLHTLKNVRDESAADFIPVHPQGDDKHKWLYGARLLLNRPDIAPLPEHNPGFAGVVEMFNVMIDSRSQADQKHAEEFMKWLVKGVRYLHELKHFKGQLTSHVGMVPNRGLFVANTTQYTAKAFTEGSFVRDDVTIDDHGRRDSLLPRSWAATHTVITNRAEISIYAGEDRSHYWRIGGKADCFLAPAYSVVKPLEHIIRLTESGMKDDRIREVVEYLCGKQTSPGDLATQVFIDSNLIPINVHALMREIPLANLYNFAYTFDRLIVELYYGVGDKNAGKIITELCREGSEGDFSRILSPKDMLVAMLISPYMKVFRSFETVDESARADMYENFVKKVMIGMTGNELARPKFLSDQLFGKMLFGELYPGRDVYGESPAHGHALREGIRREDYIEVFSKLVKDIVMAWTTGSNLRGGADEGGLLDLSRFICKYVYDNPGVRASKIIGTIVGTPNAYAKANNITAGGNANDDDKRHFISLVTVAALASVDFFHNNKSSIFAGASNSRLSEIFRPLVGILHDIREGLRAGVVDLGIDKAALEKKFARRSSSGRLKELARLLTDGFSGVDTLLEAAGGGIQHFEGKAVTDSFASARGTIKPYHRLDNSMGYPNVVRRTKELDDALNFTLHYLREGEANLEGLGATLQPDNHNVRSVDQIGSVEIPPDLARKLFALGRMRFDTVFVRNLNFIVELYRSVRFKLQRDLTYSRDIIAKSMAITRPDMTEFSGNLVSTSQPTYGPADPRYRRFMY